MPEEVMVHKTDIVLKGVCYQILVFCRPDGRYFAKTYFGEGDIIINDGASLEEALAKHEKLLPLAVSTRRVMQKFQGHHGKCNNSRSGS